MSVMKKFTQWFKNLTRVGKFGFISAVTMSALVIGSATATPQAPQATVAPTTPSISEQESVKDPVITQKTEIETEVIPFEKESVETDSLADGVTEVQTYGVNGERTTTHTITLTDGVETDRDSKTEVTKSPVNEVTRVGTYVKPVSSCNPNYSGCVPNVSYDLNCADIGYSVSVIGYDQYGLDRDNDGYGCESY